MIGIKFRMYGNYAMFKIPESNSFGRSTLVPPKTAMMGVIGAMCGITKKNNLYKTKFYPQIFDHIGYSVQLNGEDKNTFENISTSMINPNDIDNHINGENGIPNSEKYVINPDYIIHLVLVDDSNPEINKLFDEFIKMVKYNILPSSGISYNIVFGRNNCWANFEYISEDSNVLESSGTFETLSMTPRLYDIENDCNISIQNMMSKLDKDNIILKYESFMIPKTILKTSGTYWIFNDENIVLN